MSLRINGARSKSWLVGLVTLVFLLFFAASAQFAFAVGGPAILVDTGFENGTDGASLAPVWTLSGVPQHAEYDSARAKNGALSGWITGPTTAGYAGVSEANSAGMSSGGSEIRFWAYFDTTNQFRSLDDFAATAADRADYVMFSNDGNIYVRTDRTGSPNGYTTAAYTPVGTYAVGWTQFRLVYDFAGQTYTLSKRANASDAWTELKATGATGYGIPFRGVNTITSTHGTLFRAYQNTNLWLDDVAFADGGIVAPDATAPSAPSALLAADSAADQGGSVSLSWSASTDNIGVTGYRLYRGTAPGVYGPPVSLFSLTNYTDDTALTGIRYYYAVSALDAAGNEGAKSPEANATALDNLAPAVPAGLAAVGGTNQVALSWTADTEPDLAGYDLYRDGVKVNAAPLASTTYTDTGRTAGATHSYTIAAVDTHGNSSTQSAAVSATTLGTPPPVSFVDAGFESRTDGVILASPPWSVVGLPQHAEYDSARAKNGALSGWITGPTTAGYAGVSEANSAGMSSGGSEIRFWAYFDTTNQFRSLDDFAATAADRADYVMFSNDGNIYVRTDRTGSPNGYTTAAYTPVGTYAVGWTQFRLVYDFAGQTYTLSKRANASDAWTELKATGATGYGIPFRGVNTITSTHGTLFRAYQNTNLWLDDVAFADGGIVDPIVTYTITPSAGANGSIAPATSQSIASGSDSTTFAIVPASGYTIASVLVDGVSVGTPSTYRFVNVTANHTISVAFSAKGGGEMPLGDVDCDSCHEMPHGDYFIACGECHEMADKHPGTPSRIHIPADVTGCTLCHDSSLTMEHYGRKTAAGEDITCLTCHNSTDPLVVAAISLKTSACSACHEGAGHEGVHGSGVAETALAGTGQVCGDCHDADLKIEHAKAGSSSAAAGCGNCHPAPRDSLADWAGTCVEAGCHTDGSSASMHGGMTAAHAFPEERASCLALGCHDTNGTVVFQGVSVAELHSAASTTVAGVTRTSCMICHGAATVTKDCLTCHPERAATHGYDAPKHVANGTCIGTCHAPLQGLTELKPIHDAVATPVACTGCHPTKVAAVSPWDKTCTACHPIADLHPAAASSHTGTDIAYRDASALGNGCTADAGHTEMLSCHDIGNVTALHSKMDGNGCPVCHGTGKTPSRECLDCHQVGRSVTYSTPASISSALATWYPESDNFMTAGWTSTTFPTGQARYAVVNTPYPPASTARYLNITSNAAGGVLFGYASPSPVIPDNAKIVSVMVYAKGKATTAGQRKMQGFFKVGGANYQTGGLSGFLPSTGFLGGTGMGQGLSSSPIIGYDYARDPMYGEAIYGNPKTGARWTPAQLNGTDPTNSLQAFGVALTSSTAANNVSLAQVYLRISYYVQTPGEPSPTVGTSTYHHNNVKYLANPADAGGKRFGVSPPSGWYDALYYQDCYDFCHRGNAGDPVFSAPQGTWMWYSVGGDPYDALTATRKLTLKAITVPDDSPRLAFKTNYQLGAGAAGYVEISTDGGTNWSALTGTVAGTSKSSLTGDASGWSDANYDLSNFKGQSVKIRFRYVNGSSESAGWAFDSLSVVGAAGAVFSDDAETLSPDWTNSYWTRSMGAFAY